MLILLAMVCRSQPRHGLGYKLTWWRRAKNLHPELAADEFARDDVIAPIGDPSTWESVILQCVACLELD